MQSMVLLKKVEAESSEHGKRIFHSQDLSVHLSEVRRAKSLESVFCV